MFTVILTIIPTNIFAYSDYIIPSGENIGISINSKGILIVGTYEIDGISPANQAKLKIGDKIVKINDVGVDSIKDMVNQIEKSGKELNIKITYIRGNNQHNTNIKLIHDKNGVVKTGLYVKDNISGIGTISYIDPKTKIYGALGHEIIEKNSGQKIEVKDGNIYSSTVTGIDKSIKGNPGAKNATYSKDNVLGIVNKNTISGIFGEYSSNIKQENLKKVAQPNEIKIGQAKIRTVISYDEVEEFDIEIIRLNDDKNQETKNILFQITDEKLLEKTGGVVQGMSGSPIIQGDYIIGAVTHVVVDDSSKGYGIFIVNMLEEGEK